MNTSQSHIASIEIPNIAHLNHRVNLLYSQLQYTPDMTYLIEKFYTIMLFTPLPIQQHQVNLQNDQYLIDSFTADGVTVIPAHYLTFIRDMFDAVSDKIDSIVTQAQTLKMILTGQSHIAALQYEKHATGWYIVLY